MEPEDAVPTNEAHLASRKPECHPQVSVGTLDHSVGPSSSLRYLDVMRDGVCKDDGSTMPPQQTQASLLPPSVAFLGFCSHQSFQASFMVGCPVCNHFHKLGFQDTFPLRLLTSPSQQWVLGRRD